MTNQDPSGFKLLRVELTVPADTIISEIVKPGDSINPVVRTVLDNEDGALYGQVGPIRGKGQESNTFLLQAVHPETGRKSLSSLPQVKSVEILKL